MKKEFKSMQDMPENDEITFYGCCEYCGKPYKITLWKVAELKCPYCGKDTQNWNTKGFLTN